MCGRTRKTNFELTQKPNIKIGMIEVSLKLTFYQVIFYGPRANKFVEIARRCAAFASYIFTSAVEYMGLAWSTFLEMRSASKFRTKFKFKNRSAPDQQRNKCESTTDQQRVKSASTTDEPHRFCLAPSRIKLLFNPYRIISRWSSAHT